MDMKKLCPDADTVLELLYNTYYEHVCTDDTDEIKQAFDDLYNALADKTLKENAHYIILVLKCFKITDIIDVGCNIGVCRCDSLSCYYQIRTHSTRQRYQYL